MSTYIIYKTTNLINGKIYVGQHSTSANDGYLGSGKLIKRAIEKYGKENFIRETLEICTKENVDEKEIYWIDNLRVIDVNIGYNIDKGGFGRSKGFKDSHSTKYKKRLMRLGKKHSKSTKNKMSKSAKNSWKENIKRKEIVGQKTSKRQKGKPSPRLGTKTSLTAKENMKLAQLKINHKGNKNNNSKYIWKFISPDGKIFKNVYESLTFCEENNLSQPGILYAVKHSGIYKGWKVSRKMITELF